MNTPIEIYCTFDLETTGLKSRFHTYKKKGSKEEVNGNAAIIEIAICPFTNELVDLPEYHSGIISVGSDREINQGALDANGISREQIRNGKSPELVAKEVKSYFKSLAKTASSIILVGHNIDDFDIPFFGDFLNEFCIDFSSLVNTKFTMDTLWWSRVRKNEQTNFKLGTCCSEEGITLTDGHRALNDTRANKELAKKYIRSLRGEGVIIEEKEERARVKFEF